MPACSFPPQRGSPRRSGRPASQKPVSGHAREDSPLNAVERPPNLLATLPPREALRAWMGRFIDYATAKLGMADAVRAVIASGGDPYRCSQDLMLDALSSLRKTGIDNDTIRADISTRDMLAMLTGIALASGKPEQRDQAERLLDLARTD